MKPQNTLIREFVNGAKSGTASNMLVDGDVLYSYGRHFPLLVRTEFGFLLNADKYSSSTSQHQGMCFSCATIQIPFSVLGSARIDYRDFSIVDKRQRRYDKTGKWHYYVLMSYSPYCFKGKDKIISGAEYKALTKTERDMCVEQEERRPEAVVIKYNDIHYLSSMDGSNYFLCQLPEKVKTVDDAFESLKPEGLNGQAYIRQGEWFFVEEDCSAESFSTHDKPNPAKEFYKMLEQKYALPHRDGGNIHIATRGIDINNYILVSGQVRHVDRFGRRADHPMLKLSTSDDPKIFQAYQNRAVNSWSAGGRVD